MWTINGKVCVITGANAGIGKETAIGLAERGARIVLLCRSQTRGDAARDELRQRVAGAAVEVVVVDLSDLGSVRQAAREVRDRCVGIDVLIHNAGAVRPERTLTLDGYESTFATNHLGPFLLNHLLLDRLTLDRPSRIVVVASQVEARGTIDFDDLHGARHYQPLTAYCQSKLANVLFTYALARRLVGTQVAVNCLHPGVIATDLLCDYQGRSRRLGGLNRLSHPGPKDGAKTSLRLATDPALTGVSGKYFLPTGEARSSQRSYDQDLGERLWRVSEDLTGLDPA